VSATADALRKVLDVTPIPASAEPGELLDGFVAVMRARDEVIEAMTDPLPLVDDDDRAMWDDVCARHAAWQSALDGARRTIAAQLAGVRRLAAYAAPVPAASDVRSDDAMLREVG
jgi:hypothetical protein